MIFHTRIPFLFWLFAIANTVVTVVFAQNGITIPDVMIWAWAVIFIVIGLALSSNRR